MLRSGILLLVMVFVSLEMKAQEFWMQPDKFIFPAGEQVKIRFMEGVHFMGEAWDVNDYKIEKLQWHRAAGTTDLLHVLQKDADNLSVPLTNEGTQLITFKQGEILRNVEADEFNTYLKEEGLDDAYYARETKHLLGKPAREYRAQYCKLLLQAGNKRDDVYKTDTDFPVDIIPLSNPYTLATGDPVSFKILWRGQPLFGAKVKVWNRHNNRTTIQNLYTEKDGVVKTHISTGGAWMVSVTRMIPSAREGADWQSYKTTLVFGVQ